MSYTNITWAALEFFSQQLIASSMNRPPKIVETHQALLGCKKVAAEPSLMPLSRISMRQKPHHSPAQHSLQPKLTP